MSRLVVLALTVLAVLILQAQAQAERRVALIIGNGTYEEAGKLANPVNDAMDMAAKLRSLGFEVIEGNDLGKRDLERKIGEFSDALQGAEAGLFYYAGHGLQVDGRNFIVPVDARLDMPAKLRLEAVQIDDVLDIMESQTKTSLVFLDACRNNPFARSLNAKTSSRSATALAGLAQFDSTRGSFIAFSTAPGAVAMDGTGRNSPFAAALMRHIGEPGQSINDLMIAVRRDVVTETKESQRPWEQGSLLERFEFVPEGGTSLVAAASPTGGTGEGASLERSVGDTKAIEALLLDTYLEPDTENMEATVRRLYASQATILGASYDLPAIVKAKAAWFAQWASWKFALVPDTLTVTPRGETRADAVFVMNYRYVPKSASGTPLEGKARITLGFVMGDGGWRIASEVSESVQ